MIASMTAYGRGEESIERGKILVEVRSINNRFRDIQCRLPKHLSGWSEEMRKIVAQSEIKRGRVEVNLQIDETLSGQDRNFINEELAMNYFISLKKLCANIGMQDEPKLSDLLSFRDIFEIPESDEHQAELWNGIQNALRKALDALVEMRHKEGETLAKDIRKRLKRLSERLEQVKGRAPQVQEDYRNRLRKRLKEFVAESEIDENRFLQEVVIFTDRSDITEEVVRAKSHLDQFAETLKKGGTVGRKLDFLLQELFREINTTASKANDVIIGKLAVEMKNEVEKIREQIQNIE